MNPTVQDIAASIQAKKRDQKANCVIMLGAGASIGSGAKPTTEMMEGLLATYGKGIQGERLVDRFERLWHRADDDERRVYLSEYLDLEPGAGYEALAALIKAGYFDLVITFNFDRLVEKALEALGWQNDRDFLVIVRGEYRDDAAVRAVVRQTQPRVKILKMHGSLLGGDTFLFERKMLHEYQPDMASLLRELTEQDIIVCGYAFEDACVEKAFSTRGGHIFCVNRNGVPPRLENLVDVRKSKDYAIKGTFDDFFADLSSALRGDEDATPPKANPFKFLASYEIRDRPWFFGRDALTDTVLQKVDAHGKVVHLHGDRGVGKTSFARAGLLAYLDPHAFRPIYLRCRETPLEPWLAGALAELVPGPLQHASAAEAVVRLVAAAGTHPVVVLDQFERIIGQYPSTETGFRDLLACLDKLADWAQAGITFICVGTEDAKNRYMKAIVQGCKTGKCDDAEIARLEEDTVAHIVTKMAEAAGIEFQAEVIQAIVKKYKESASSEPRADRSEGGFALAHVQAVCNVLASSSRVNLSKYEEKMSEIGRALETVVSLDVVSLVEDIPDETRRDFFRKVMKVIRGDSMVELAKTLNKRFADLMTPPEAVATIVAQR